MGWAKQEKGIIFYYSTNPGCRFALPWASFLLSFQDANNPRDHLNCRTPWAAKWPVGLPELDGWMEGPEGGGKMPVPTDAAQARFAEQVNKMIRVIRCLHYSYRTEEAYVGWARRFLSFS